MNVTLNRRTLLDALEIARRWVVPQMVAPPEWLGDGETTS